MRPRGIFRVILSATAGITAMVDVAAEEMVVAAWGGVYEASQESAYFQAYRDTSGVAVSTRPYRGGLDELKEQVNRGEVTWDLVDLVMADHDAACDGGLLQPMDPGVLAPGSDSASPEDDFLPGALVDCGVAHAVYANVIGFDARAFPGEKPEAAADFFDLERFPGKRALQKQPVAILEWALRAYDVPRADIYQLLSTARGLDLAFRKLDHIRDHIVWWDDADEPAQLLADRVVTMATGYNGRFFDAAVTRNLPVQIIWESQVYEYSVWGIPRGAPNTAAALDFVRFATAPQQMAALSSRISYGPARLSANHLVWKHLASGIDIRPHLPTYPPHLARGIPRDHQWYARSMTRLSARFEQWLSR